MKLKNFWDIAYPTYELFVCVGVLRPNQQGGHVEPVS